MFTTLLYQSIILILFLTFSMGPAFFALLNISLTLSKSRARVFAAGVILSDLIICFCSILILHFGFHQWFVSFKYKKFMGILAGSLLVMMGGLFLKNPFSRNSGKSELMLRSFSLSVLFYKGFFLNFFNPGIWIMWIGNVTITSNIMKFSIWKTIFYYLLILFSTSSIEWLKIQMASRLKKIISGKVLIFFNIFTGMALVLFGFYLMYSFFFERYG